MHWCSGLIASVDEEAAVITDSAIRLRIPYAAAGDCAVATLDVHSKSVTLTWRDGTSAFIITRHAQEDPSHLAEHRMQRLPLRPAPGTRHAQEDPSGENIIA